MTQWGIDTLFNPSKRHMDEEKQRLQMTREEVGDSSGGRRIDLESGKVVIRRQTEQDGAPQAVEASIDSDDEGNDDEDGSAEAAENAPAGDRGAS